MLDISPVASPTDSQGHSNLELSPVAYIKSLIWSSPGPAPAGSTATSSAQLVPQAPNASPFASFFGCGDDSHQQPDQNVAAQPAAAAAAEGLQLAGEQEEEDVSEKKLQQREQRHQKQQQLASHPTSIEPEDLATSEDERSDSEDEWVDDDSDDMFPAIFDMLQSAWYGITPPSPHRSPNRQQLPLAKSRAFPEPPASRPRALLNRNRQVSISRRQPDSKNSSLMPNWLRQQLPARGLLNRSASWRAKPFKQKLAEQVLGEDVADAVERIQAEILDSKDPLPEAIVKFVVKTSYGVAKGWANKNVNRVFAAFGAYVAATCGVLHVTKQAVKWLAWRLPGRSKRIAGPVVRFTADTLLPTQFFGPWLATYVVVKILVKERQQVKAAAEAAAVEAAKATAAAAVGHDVSAAENAEVIASAERAAADAAASVLHASPTADSQPQQPQQQQPQQQDRSIVGDQLQQPKHKQICSAHHHQQQQQQLTRLRSPGGSRVHAGKTRMARAAPGRARQATLTSQAITGHPAETAPSGDVWGLGS